MPSIYTVFNDSTEFGLSDGDASEKAIYDLIIQHMDDYPVYLEQDGDRFRLGFDGEDVGDSFPERVSKLVEAMAPHVTEPFMVQIRIESMSDDERDTFVFGGPDVRSAEDFRDRHFLKEAMETLRNTGNPYFETMEKVLAGKLVDPEEIQVVVVMDGGLIQNVVGTHAVRLNVVDYDTEGADEDGLAEIPQGDGSTVEAYCFSHEVEVNKEWCDQVVVAMNHETESVANTATTTSGIDIDADQVAEWVGLHYGRNFDAESPEKKQEWVDRFAESHGLSDETPSQRPQG